MVRRLRDLLRDGRPLGWGPGLGAEGHRPSASLRAVLPMPDRGLAGLVRGELARGARLPAGGDARWPWRRSSAGSTAPRAPRRPATTIRPGQIIAAEGLATLVGGLFGGVIQSTPYIGHPAYKAMGARAAYTLATALFVGGGGVLGYFDWIFYPHSQAGRLPDPDLRRPGDHRAVVPRDRPPALSRGGPGVRAGPGVPGPDHPEPGPSFHRILRNSRFPRSIGSKP